MNYSPTDLVILLVLIVVSCVITAAVTQSSLNQHWQKECNQRGVSRFNSVTGKWEWKTPAQVVETPPTPPLLPAPSTKE